MKNKILISCANGEISFELISLLKKNYYIIGIDNNKFGLASRICDEFYLSPIGSSKKFPIFLDKISKKVDAIFLFADEEILNISKNIINYKNLRKKILISDYNVVELCNDKKKLLNYLENLVQIPIFRNHKKVIIKPKIGRGSKNIMIIKDPNIIREFRKNNNYLIQEFIDGKEYTVDCFFKRDGSMHQSVSRERVIKKNVSIVGKIVKDKKIDSIVLKISKILKFVGSINFQFIKKNKKYYLIEINPRISGSIIFSIKSSFDIVKLHLNHINKLPLQVYKIQYNKFYYRYYLTHH